MDPNAILKAAKVLKNLTHKDKDGNSGGKKGLIVAICLSSILVLVPAAVISAPGLIVKGLINKFCSFFTGGSKDDESKEPDEDDLDNIEDAEIDENFDITKSEIYGLVKDVYIDYNKELDETVSDYVEDITEQYTYTYEKKVYKDKVDKDGKVVYDKNGNPEQEETTETIEVKPNISKSTNLQKPEIQLPLAYLSTKYDDIVAEDDTYLFDEDEMLDFLDDITTKFLETYLIKDNTNGDPKEVKCFLYTTILPAEDIANKIFTEEEYGEEYDARRQLYVCSYESLKDIDDEDVTNSYNHIDMGALTFYPNGMEIPHYLQYDPKWCNISYGTGIVKNTACGPTSMAMVISYLNNTTVTPADVVHWAGNRYYVAGQGSSWSLFPAVAEQYGIKCSELGKNAKAVVDALSNGCPVIASMGPGTFTSGGHFIVLRGITEDGKILVNDPNDNTYSKKFYEREFDLALFMNEGKNFWKFWK